MLQKLNELLLAFLQVQILEHKYDWSTFRLDRGLLSQELDCLSFIYSNQMVENVLEVVQVAMQCQIVEQIVASVVF